MASNLKPITNKQALIVVSGLPGIYWSSNKGGKMAYEEVGYNDGQTGIEQTHTGMMKIEPLTLSKAYDPVNDAAIQSFITAQAANATPFNVTVTPVNPDVAGTPIAGGRPMTYPNCKVLSYTPPQFDRDGSGLARCELMVAVNSLPTY